MPVTLGSNIASLRGQRNLNKITGEVRTVYERLSSGLRINRAADDAAGLAVSESLKADSRIYTQGVRNINDGISLLSIADSALENLSGIVFRLQELAEQAANGVYGSKQRQALDVEAQKLSAEFTRIQQSASFNGRQLLNGSLSSLQIQAGVGLDAILNLGVGGAVGTGAFDTANSAYTFGTQDTATQYVDLNGDGFGDMVAINQLSAALNVYYNDGSGNFSSSTSYAADGSVSALAVGDVNNDGILDLTTGNGASNSISLYLGNGDGSFQAAMTYNTSVRISDISLGDINNDGFLDLVGTSNTAGSIAVMLGSGNGTFQAGTSVASALNTQIVLSDLNGDGQLDIGAFNLGTISIYSGYGNGTFNSVASTILTGVAAANNLLTQDLNNDGRLDLAVSTSNASGSTRVYLNQGSGTFDSGNSYTSAAASTHQSNFSDVNGDGYLDLVNAGANGASIHINQGNGTFGSGTVYNSTTSYRYSLIAGDVNNDGVLDLVGTSATATHVSIGSTTPGVAPILPFSLNTAADARQALSMLKNKAALLSKQRGQIGAYQARLNVAGNVLSTTKENYQTAAGRIKDADIAAESANLVRNQILQQAASAVLAQANQQPQLALRLLQ